MTTLPFEYPTGNYTGMLDLMVHANSLVSNMLGIVILIVITMISFITSRSMGFSVFLSFIVALMLRFLNLITDTVLYIVVVLLAAVIIWMWYAKQQEEV